MADQKDLRNKIGEWNTALIFARRRFAASGTKDDADSVTFAEAKLNQYIDQYLAAGGGGRVAPTCHSGACTQTMSSFGTRTWLCPECDFRECVGCRQRVHSFTATDCPHCGFTIAAPRSADDELD